MKVFSLKNTDEKQLAIHLVLLNLFCWALSGHVCKSDNEATVLRTDCHAISESN
jgi:hypothetical protein